MKRILFLSPTLGYNGGGAERQIVNVACSLHNCGYEVEFLCYSEGDFYIEPLREQNIKVHWHIFPSHLRTMLFVRRFIRRNKYDVVISFLEAPNFLNCFSAIGRKNWKVIIGERSTKELNVGLRSKIYASLQRFADLLVANSENAVNLRIAQFPYLKGKTKVIYNRIVVNDTQVDYTPKQDDKLNVLILASYQYLKNSIGLINVVNAMSEEERNKFNINWYGNTAKTMRECYEETISKVKEYKLENVLHFNEQTDKAYEKIKQSDVVALFSKFEGLPNAICEGMVVGKPIIMSRVSDYSTLVDESNGFLCDWDDAESIKKALLQMASLSKEELMEKGKNSKKKADILFSAETVTNHWIEAVEG